jgi:hypothetical protein
MLNEIDDQLHLLRLYLFANDRNISSAVIMAWKEQKCNIKRRRNSDRWIIHIEFLMVVRSEFRQEERIEEENKSQMLDLSVDDQHSSDLV